MKSRLARSFAAVLFALQASAAIALMSEEEAVAAVQAMLEDEKSAEEIIQTLMLDGRSLEEATVLAVRTAEDHAKLNIARVGICLSVDVKQAEEVGQGCLEVCSPEVDEIIESLIEGYVTGACDPPDYEISSKTVGGAASPSS